MLKRITVLAVFALLAGTANAFAQKPESKPGWREQLRRMPYGERAATRSLAAAAVLLAEVAESEPNDDAASADAVSLGDQGTGAIDPAGDWDWWVFGATAGAAIGLEVVAAQVGSDLDPYIYLYDTDGITLLAEDDDGGPGLDSFIPYVIPADGNYYLAIREYSDGYEGGPTYTYTINFNELQPGPGDPTTEIASGLAAPFGIAAAADGDFYVVEVIEERVLRVTPSGSVTDFASVPIPWGNAAFDAFGGLLVPSDDGNVYRVTPAGSASPFLTDMSIPFWVAQGPDGSIWVSDLDPGTIRHYQPDGTFVETIDVSAVGGAGPIGFSPSGVLHFSTGPDLYRMVGDSPQAVVTDQPFMWGFSFDEDGNIYVCDYGRERIILYDPTGAILADPFSIDIGISIENAFGRNADGTWNARLFATDIDMGTVVEFNSDGVLAPGAPLGLSLDMMSVDLAADELLGVSGSLSDGEMDFLDWLGNGNGDYDVGDFRALLVETGVVSGSLSPAVQALLEAGHNGNPR